MRDNTAGTSLYRSTAKEQETDLSKMITAYRNGDGTTTVMRKGLKTVVPTTGQITQPERSYLWQLNPDPNKHEIVKDAYGRNKAMYGRKK